MDLSGSYRFEASIERVWDRLMDPSVIASCIPWCQSLEPDGEDRYRARLALALASITGTYDGTVVIAEKTPPAAYRLVVEGQGKPGFVKGSALVSLRQEGAQTVVDVAGTVQAGGPIARVGQRLLASVGRMMQDQFFACLAGKV